MRLWSRLSAFESIACSLCSEDAAPFASPPGAPRADHDPLAVDLSPPKVWITGLGGAVIPARETIA